MNYRNILAQHAEPIICRHLEPLAAKSASALAAALATAWSEMPPALKLLGQAKLRWEHVAHAISKSDAWDHDSVANIVKQAFDQAYADVAPGSPTPKPTLVASAALPATGITTPNRVVSGQVNAPVKTTREPPKPSAPARNNLPRLGIDLGTTYSVAAFVDSHGRPQAILNSHGDRLTPSTVFVDVDGVLVGKEAIKAGMAEPERFFACVKREMGNPSCRQRIAGEKFPPEVISSFILKRIKADAENKLGPIGQVVITVPAYFDEARRQATMTAGQLAGLDVLGVVNEPTAAALAHVVLSGFVDQNGVRSANAPKRILVFDLGGGTFDVSIVTLADGVCEVIATDGDVQLGGKDWDARLVALLEQQFVEQIGRPVMDHPEAEVELMQTAEEIKRSLTERSSAAATIRSGRDRVRASVTREQFESATASLVTQTEGTVEVVLRQAGLQWQDIDQILLVGGSTRMPMISSMLERISGRPVVRSEATDELVAYGAALFAQQWETISSQIQNRLRVIDVSSHSLGLEVVQIATKQRINQVVIPKHSALPIDVVRQFPTLRDGQKNIPIKVLEGDSPRPEYCRKVGQCTINQLPADLKKGEMVEVRFSYNRDGRLAISARLVNHPNVHIATVFSRDNQLPENDVALWTHYIEDASQLAMQ